MEARLIGAAALAAFVLGALGTARVRRHALRSGLLDIPNARSSHSVPVPRGGGVAIVGATLLVVLALASAGVVAWRDGCVFALPGLLIAATGYVDDRRSLGAGVRLSVHVLACAVAVLGGGAMPALGVGALVLPAGAAATVVTIVALVWYVNLYNFMDGIDGIAAGTAVVVGATLYALAPAPAVAYPAVALAIAAASAGFLPYNWPPARIFMGDVGSGFLGYALGWCVVAGLRSGTLTLAAALVLLAPFVIDATVTLVTRALRGAKVHEAHRSHLYQRLSRRFGAHRPVTLLYVTSTAGILAPLAAWVGSERAIEGRVVLAVYAAGAAIAVALGAGRDEGPQREAQGPAP